MKLAINSKPLSVIQMENHHHQQQQQSQEPQGRYQDNIIGTNQHIQILQDNIIRLSSLLERYHDFTKDFVFKCVCLRSREESLRIGGQYNELASEYQLLAKSSTDFSTDPHPPPPPPHTILQMRKPQHELIPDSPEPPKQNNNNNNVQQRRQIHNESPQQRVLHYNNNSNNNHQMSFNNNITPQHSTVIANHSNHNQRSQTPLTTTITLSEEADEPSDLNDHHHPQPNIIHVQPSVHVQLNQFYHGHQQLSPGSSEQLINRLKADQLKQLEQLEREKEQQEQQQLLNGQAQNIIIRQQANSTFPTIENASNETILIHATVQHPNSTSTASKLQPQAISISSQSGNASSDRIISNGLAYSSIVENGNANNVNNIMVANRLVQQQQSQQRHLILNGHLQESQQQQQQILKIVNPNNYKQVVINGNGNQQLLVSTSNGIEHVTTTSMSPTNHLIHHSSGAIPQQQFQTVEQLEAQQQISSRTIQRLSPDSPIYIATINKSHHQPSMVSGVSPGAISSHPISKATTPTPTTHSVIHTNQAYILSNQSSLAQQQQQQQQSRQQQQITSVLNHGNATSTTPQIITYSSSSQATSTPTITPQQQQNNQNVMLLKRKMKLATAGESQQHVIVSAADQQNLSLLQQNRQLDLATKSSLMSTIDHTPTSLEHHQLASSPLNGHENVFNLSSTSSIVSPVCTPTSASNQSVGGNGAVVVNLSSSSSSNQSTSSSSMSSLIARTILANQDVPLTNLLLSDELLREAINGTNMREEDAMLIENGGFTQDPDGYWRCSLETCTFSTTSKPIFVAHIRKSHQIVRPFKCHHPGCSATFKEKYKLKVHAVVHTGEKPFGCDWPGCNARFSQSGHVSRHRKTHMGTQKYACTWANCTRSFIQKHTLKYHLMMHKGEKPWTCGIDNCGRAFIEKWKLVKHQKTHALSGSANATNGVPSDQMLNGHGVQQQPKQTIVLIKND